MPIQFVFGHLGSHYQKKMLRQNDERLKLVNELLQGIKIIRFYAWEAIFLRRVRAERDKQLDLLLIRRLLSLQPPPPIRRCPNTRLSPPSL